MNNETIYITDVMKALLDYDEFPNESIRTARTAGEIAACYRRGMPVSVAVAEIVWGAATLADAEEFCRRNGWEPDEQFFLDLAKWKNRQA